jgi:hypothetical protein
VTADAKTNWFEGAMMIAFYAMIAMVAWFYPGQRELEALITCGLTKATGATAAA